MCLTETGSSVDEASPSRGRNPATVTVVSWLREAARHVTSLPALFVSLVVVTVLSGGPLHGFDEALNKPWSTWILPDWRSFFQDVIDPIASQSVGLPILGVVAVLLAWRRRSTRPILVAGAVEIGVVGAVGAMKLALARPAPVMEDPAFFAGGILKLGWHGISYPSGHAAEAVLLYGAIVYLLARYSAASRRTIALLTWAVALITGLATLTSLYLGWHWATDLLAGVLTGGLVLRAAARADTLPVASWPDDWLRAWLRRRRPAGPEDVGPVWHPPRQPQFQDVGTRCAGTSSSDSRAERKEEMA